VAQLVGRRAQGSAQAGGEVLPRLAVAVNRPDAGALAQVAAPRRASNGKVTLDAAVALQEGKVKVRMWKEGKEDAPLDEKSPLWADIRIVGGDGKPAKELPLKDGYFEVALPRAIFEGNPNTVTLN
jgi:hypothetical protein